MHPCPTKNTFETHEFTCVHLFKTSLYLPSMMRLAVDNKNKIIASL